MKETVKKEVKEETGLEATEIEFLEAKDGGNPDDFSRDTHFIFLNFACRAENQEVELDNREAVDYRWVDPEDALEADLRINNSTQELIRTWLQE